ncbi:hypothetical protein BT67DRAFT_38878 [Trichocladium antarcticum]|uniref:Uncharacterized protein n=1 Tax=Trichocladium antarcticum TaxID=1450529 RepID=A0AAN6ZC58_9PEZI|nr:hypothetical protein BT67DRAFT_38878 [Trichocladium antarcticum]
MGRRVCVCTNYEWSPGSVQACIVLCCLEPRGLPAGVRVQTQTMTSRDAKSGSKTMLNQPMRCGAPAMSELGNLEVCSLFQGIEIRRVRGSSGGSECSTFSSCQPSAVLSLVLKVRARYLSICVALCLVAHQPDNRNPPSSSYVMAGGKKPQEAMTP